MKIITTNEHKKQYWKEEELQRTEMTDCMHTIDVYPEVKYQQFQGFGAALTEASAHIYGLMEEDKRTAIIQDCYGTEGLRYNLGRIHMNSCDFALGNYCYVEDGDKELRTFSIAHDKKEILPMISDAQAAAAGTGGIRFLMSPWSPPAFMKTNGEMNHGGRLKKEYYESWADYFVKFIQEYEKEGAAIAWVTVQNEPMAEQTWDSCIYSSEEEALFVREYLGPKMKEAGLSEIGIFVWDHNKEEVYQRLKAVIGYEGTSAYIAGAAVHWYTGDHFEAVEMVKKQYPDKEIFFTEGCVEYSRFADSGEVQKAEMYAHDILGNLNAGISASLDWNILLDEQGGPNHVGNFCAAPLMCNPKKGTYEKRLSYYYIGQFSRYLKCGAVRIGTSRYTDGIEVTGFLNPDGERVIVMLNKSEKEWEYTLREEGVGCIGTIEAHSIKTICYEV